MHRIEVKVIARASKCEVIQLSENNFKVKLTRPALEGKANEQLREVLSEYFKKPKANVKIVSGEHNALKRVELL